MSSPDQNGAILPAPTHSRTIILNVRCNLTAGDHL